MKRAEYEGSSEANPPEITGMLHVYRDITEWGQAITT